MTNEKHQLHMNNQLRNLYATHWDSLLEEAEGKDAANPLLIKVREEYEKADIKIMICGQETYGWNGTIKDKHSDIDFLMNDYEAYLYNDQNFFSTNQLYIDAVYSKDGNRLKKKNRRGFWNANNFKYFQEQLKFEDKSVAFVWNNLSKIGNSAKKGKGRGRATKEIQNIENEYFRVFAKELDILQPDVIIFRTGNRKIDIGEHQDEAVSERINIDNPIKTVAFKKHPEIFALKTYHPVSRIAKKNINPLIVEKIKTHINNLEKA